MRTDDQLDVQLTITIETKKISDYDRKKVMESIKSGAKSAIEDPWTPIRQHLLHMYRIKNIRVSSEPGTDHLGLEIVTNEHLDVDKVLGNYKSGSFRSVFPDYVKLPDIKDAFKFSVWIDEHQANRIRIGIKKFVSDVFSCW